MTTKRLSIAGNLPMSHTEAQELIDSGHTVVLHVWGEGPYRATVTATPKGLGYCKELLALGDAAVDSRPEVRAYVLRG